MAKKIPEGIKQCHILNAINDIDKGVLHPFGKSTGYDMFFQGKRYPPKAVLGIAIYKLTGNMPDPSDFKGGLKSPCFRVLENLGYTIITKSDLLPFPNEIDENGKYFEGALQQVSVNRYERDPQARKSAIQHHGKLCQVCNFDFEKVYGALGLGFIHVHHVLPLSSVKETYNVNPINDLKPVCPNCHAMLHKRIPPYEIDELKKIIELVKQSYL